MGIFLPFLSLPFNTVTGLAFGVRFGFLREVKAIESLPDLPSPSPSPAPTACAKAPRKENVAPVRVSAGSREARLGFKKSTRKWLVQKFSSNFAPPEESTHEPRGGGGWCPAQRPGHLTCGGGLEGWRSWASWGEQPSHLSPTSPIPITPFSEPFAPSGALNCPLTICFLLVLPLQMNQILSDLYISVSTYISRDIKLGPRFGQL